MNATISVNGRSQGGDTHLSSYKQQPFESSMFLFQSQAKEQYDQEMSRALRKIENLGLTISNGSKQRKARKRVKSTTSRHSQKLDRSTQRKSSPQAASDNQNSLMSYHRPFRTS
mmetsp:Transcript_4859/g.7309  ORF Transcript_4859/g.7309 Transcript_4859/m.7309 type:complete len:114 (+) Transcript_4859:33-374(+)